MYTAPVSTVERTEEIRRPIPIQAIDYIEFYVGNAKQAAYFFRSAFGFTPIAYSGPETGVKDRVSYVLEQNEIRFVITASLSNDDDVANHVRKHGDGIRNVALRVDDVDVTFSEVSSRGAKVLQEPLTVRDEHGVIRKATIATYGDTVHTFIDRRNYSGPFAPGYIRRESSAQPVGLKRVDHVVGNVELGKMDEWVDYYQKVMGFYQLISFDDKDISTEYSALRSKVVHDGMGRIKFPINEPAAGRRKSQIQEYLDFYKGPGVQHLAIATDNIIHTIPLLRERGIEFLNVPDSYYDALQERMGNISVNIEDLRRLRILVDRDDKGFLLQLFTKPLVDRPTLFFEIIERQGSESFGKGNFRALFEAIEREQALRGNL